MYFLQNATNQISQALNPLQDIAKALHDSDRNNIVLAGATIVLALATIIFGIFDRRRTQGQIRRSEQRSNDEQFERMRPWITLEHPKPAQVIFANGEALLWDRFRAGERPDLGQPVKIVLAIKYTNTGIKPATRLAKISYGDFTSITKEKFEQMEETQMDLDLGPNSEQFQPFTFEWLKWLELNNTPVFLALRISYNNGRIRSHSGIMCKVTRHFAEISSSWYD